MDPPAVDRNRKSGRKETDERPIDSIIADNAAFRWVLESCIARQYRLVRNRRIIERKRPRKKSVSGDAMRKGRAAGSEDERDGGEAVHDRPALAPVGARGSPRASGIPFSGASRSDEQQKKIANCVIYASWRQWRSRQSAQESQ